MAVTIDVLRLKAQLPYLHPNPAPPSDDPTLDLDGDGLGDSVIFEDENILVTEDGDSYNIDLDGDEVADIVIPK